MMLKKVSIKNCRNPNCLNIVYTRARHPTYCDICRGNRNKNPRFHGRNDLSLTLKEIKEYEKLKKGRYKKRWSKENVGIVDLNSNIKILEQCIVVPNAGINTVMIMEIRKNDKRNINSWIGNNLASSTYKICRC